MMASLQTISMVVFWVCASLIAYTYIVYPPLVWILSRLFGREKVAPESNLPSVSLLIAAHNEEMVMEQRLANALKLDYPRDRLEIVVASDGSTDDTAEIVRCYANQGVRLIELSPRRGKASAINRAMSQLQCEIVLLSDANTELDPQAVKKLVRWFGDPQIGVVCGRLVLSDPQTGNNADSIYWRFETILKQCESRLGGLLGANGAIYAIRRSIYVPIPDDTIVDDMAIPLLARLNSHCGIIYDVEATAWEPTAPDIREEFHRRARIGTGNFQNAVLLRRLLNPLQGFVAFSFFSHKILRWLCPFFLIGLFVANLALLGHDFYRLSLLAQLVAYVLAFGGLVIPLPKLLRLPALFVGMNAALLVGFGRWLFHARQGTWRPTNRTEVA